MYTREGVGNGDLGGGGGRSTQAVKTMFPFIKKKDFKERKDIITSK